MTRRRVALVSDTHGHLDPRIAEVAAACDLVIHAGDVGAGSILWALGSGGADVLAVAGNTDTDRHWPGHDREGLRELQESLLVELPGGRLVAVHGHRLPAKNRHARLRALFPDAGGIVYGHSHRAVTDTDAVPWVLNPGAAGRTRTYGGPSCLVLDARDERWRLDPRRFPLLPR